MKLSDIATVYDQFNDESVYEYWVEFTREALNQRPQSAIDLACGTGTLTLQLAELTDKLIGIDIDPEMIRVAQAKLADTHLSNVSFEQGDMRALMPNVAKSSVQLVTCFLDSICFLDTLDDVKKTMQEVYQLLEEDGVFLFDVWSSYHMQVGFNGFEYFDYNDQATLLWQSTTFPEELAVEHDLTVFIQQEGSIYERKDVTVREQTYYLRDYMDALMEAGFQEENIQVLVNFGWELYRPESHFEMDRLFFRCYK